MTLALSAAELLAGAGLCFGAGWLVRDLVGISRATRRRGGEIDLTGRRR